MSSSPPQSVSKQQFQNELAAGLLCLTCHALDGKGGTQAVDFASISHRLQPDWVRQFLVAPSRFGVPPATMPGQFYHVTADGRSFAEILPQSARRIQILTDYFLGLSLDKRTVMEQRLAAARASNPDANPALGETLFRALNCAACHLHQTIPARAENAAPDLNREGDRVLKAWLDNYLKHPVAIRPFGHQPGDGSRMPDYRLSGEEVTELSAFLLSRRTGTTAVEFRPRKLSAFSSAKARRLLEEKVSCLGCHRLGERGGRIGPDLTNVRSRLQGEYVYNIIKSPRAVTPHSVMPQIPLSTDTIQLLANYLLQQGDLPRPERYLSPAENPLLSLAPATVTTSTNARARHNYRVHCAACHGEQGRGDGFNARFLPVKPTVHADATHMARRPDDTLYDGIHSGGYILNKSPMMPPWGQSLSAVEIKELVAYMRTLCRCEGPAWSRDN